MKVARRANLYGTLVVCILAAGCAHQSGPSAFKVTEELAPLEVLERSLGPFANADYVRIRGVMHDPRQRDRPFRFRMLLGPEGRFLYDNGENVYFCDGSRCGRWRWGLFGYDKTMDQSVQEFSPEGKGPGAFSIVMARGPAIFAYAQVAGAKWTTDFATDGLIVSKLRFRQGSDIEIVFRETDDEVSLSFVLTGEDLRFRDAWAYGTEHGSIRTLNLE